jgi:hypothetical protein
MIIFKQRTKKRGASVNKNSITINGLILFLFYNSGAFDDLRAGEKWPSGA